MKIYLSPSTAGRYGGVLKGNLQYFDKLIQSELDKTNFYSSFEVLWLTLSYPPLYVLPGVVGIEVDFKKYYDKLPYSRLNRRYKKIDVVLKAPEFSEHFDKEEQSKYKHKFENEDKYKRISETKLTKILIDTYFEAATLIKSKLKKEDIFDFTTFEKILNILKNKITPEFLQETAKEQKAKLQILQIEIAELKRMERRERNLPKDKLIRDIRLFYAYKLPQNLFYLNRFADIVLSRLIAKDFRCPHYNHLYISIADTQEEALIRAIPAEGWFTYGITVLEENVLLKASDSEQQSLILNTIQQGLLDIANLDNLDKTKIIEAVKEVKEIGALSEVSFKKKENNKIAFTITTKTILGKNKEEIYFTVIDKETHRTAKWKFGEENIYLIEGWFGTITVTNKFIRTKPRAYMDLVLRGKQMCLEIDVEKELNDPAKVIQNTF